MITDDFSKWAEMMKRFVESGQDSLQPAEERSTSVARQRSPFFLPVKKEATPKQIEAPQKDVVTKDAENFAVDPKVKTILKAFSADHDIFWFRYYGVIYEHGNSSLNLAYYFSENEDLQDLIIPEPMKLIKAMRTIIRQVYYNEL